MTTMAQPQTRTLTTRNGKTVETWLTDQEAKDMLRGISNLSNFAADLLRKIRANEKLSPEQMIWVHIIVVEHETKKKNPVVRPVVKVGDMKKVIDMFNHAKQHLKYPRIWLKVNGVKIRLSLATSKSKYEGSVQIIADNSNVYINGVGQQREWLGRVSPEGEFIEGFQKLPGLREFLVAFAQDPIMIAREYGKLMGSCCFCNKTLGYGDDQRSIEVGYGPVCADHYGLVWGV